MRVALLTTASMISLLRDQFQQVSATMPQEDDGKFQTIFRSKLTNLGNDLLEFQSLIPVAEQMFCSAWDPKEVVSVESTPKMHPEDLKSIVDMERINLFLCSKETSADNTPPPSVNFGKAWPEDWVSTTKQASEPGETLQEPPTFPALPINENIWSVPAVSGSVLQRTPSKDSDGKHSVKGKSSQKSDHSKDMPAEKKKTLVKFIYTLMQQKGLTDPAGHLLMDVYVEIWKEVVGGQGCGGRVAFHRFAEMLRSAPEYFELFHIGIAVDENGCSFSGKQRAKMVRLVPQSETVDGGLTPPSRS
jgi:hypothetical protein